MKLRKHQELLWLEELERRGGLTEELQRELMKRRTGYQGEEDFGQVMSEFMPKNWLLIQDLRLKTLGGEIQIDAVLVNNVGLTVFEVKNYSADYQYISGSWHVNGRKKYHDDFKQLDRTADLLSQLLHQKGFKVPVKQFVVYINEQDSVEIDDASLPFLKRATIRRFIKSEKERGQIAPNQNYNCESDWLLQKHVADDRRLSLSEADYLKLEKGIYCVRCHSFSLESTRYHLCCQDCHYKESKEKAIVRTICDYGLLFPYKDLNVVEMSEFIGEIVSLSSLYILFGKYFEKKERSNSYMNPLLPFQYTDLPTNFYYKDKIPIKDNGYRRLVSDS